MTARQVKLVSLGLWTLYGVLAVGGLLLLAEALFMPRPARPFVLKLSPAQTVPVLGPLPGAKDELLGRRFTRRVSAAPAPATAQKTTDLSLDRLIKLTGILDFGGKKPTLAVIETSSDSKAYKAGDKVGETGVLIKDIKDYVIVEYETRRYKVTYLGIQELPAAALGRD